MNADVSCRLSTVLALVRRDSVRRVPAIGGLGVRLAGSSWRCTARKRQRCEQREQREQRRQEVAHGFTVLGECDRRGRVSNSPRGEQKHSRTYSWGLWGSPALRLAPRKRTPTSRSASRCRGGTLAARLTSRPFGATNAPVTQSPDDHTQFRSLVRPSRSTVSLSLAISVLFSVSIFVLDDGFDVAFCFSLPFVFIFVLDFDPWSASLSGLFNLPESCFSRS